MAVTAEEINIKVTGDINDAKAKLTQLKASVASTMSDINAQVLAGVQKLNKTLADVGDASSDDAKQSNDMFDKLLKAINEVNSAVKELTKSFNEASKKIASSGIKEVNKQAQDATQSTKELEQTTNQIMKYVESLAKSFGELVTSVGDTNKFTKSISDMLASMQKLQGASENIAEVGATSAEAGEGASALSGALAELAGVASTVLIVVGALAVAIVAVVAEIKIWIATVKALYKIISTVVTPAINLILKSLKAFVNLVRTGISRAINLMISSMSKGINHLVQVDNKLNASLSALKSSMTQFGNALATAVAPIINAVTPALEYLLNLVINIANAMAQVTASLFGNATQYKKASKVVENYAQSVANAQNSLQGFDELNVLGNNNGEASVYDMFETENISSDILDFTQGLKDLAVKVKLDFDNGDYRKAGEDIADALNEAIKKLDTKELGKTIAGYINNGLEFVNGFLSKADFTEIGVKIADFLSGCVEDISPTEIGELIGNLVNKGFELVEGFVTNFNWTELGEKIGSNINAFFKTVKWDEVGKTISDTIKGLLDTLISTVDTIDWDAVGEDIGELLCNIDWAGVLTRVLELVAKVFVGLNETITSTVKTIVKAIIKELGTQIANSANDLADIGRNIIAGLYTGIILKINSIATWIDEHIITPIVDAVKNGFGIHSPSTVFADIGTNLIEGLKNGITDTWSKITDWWDTNIAPKLKAEWWTNKFKNIKTGLKSTFKSAINGVIDIIEKGVNYIINKINTIHFDVPEALQGIVGMSSFGFNLNTLSIPRLENGGVLTKPTAVVAGEYAGADNNPEIVTPQDLMYKTNMQANVPVMNAIEEMTDTLVGAINGMSVYAEFNYDKLRVGLNKANKRSGNMIYGGAY